MEYESNGKNYIQNLYITEIYKFFNVYSILLGIYYTKSY